MSPAPWPARRSEGVLGVQIKEASSAGRERTDVRDRRRPHRPVTQITPHAGSGVPVVQGKEVRSKARERTEVRDRAGGRATQPWAAGALLSELTPSWTDERR